MFDDFSKSPLIPKIIAYFLIFAFVYYIAYTGFNFLFHRNSGPENKAQEQSQNPQETQENQDLSIKNSFGEYVEYPVKYSAQVSDYEIKNDLSNVVFQGYKEYSKILSDNQKKNLVKYGFVVSKEEKNNGYKSQYDEFYKLYEENRYQNTPNFITTDSVLHSYHLAYNEILADIEKNYFVSDLKKLNELALLEAYKYYDQLKGSSWENASKRVLGLITVGAKLMDDKIKIHEAIKDCADTELKRIKEQKNIIASCVLNIGSEINIDSTKEDYSQYIPRGHYEKNEDLKRYFKSMMWYGRSNFSFKEDDNIKSAVLISLILQDQEKRKIWDNIYQTTSFFVGKSDDLGIEDVEKVVKNIYQDNLSIDLISKDNEKFLKLKSEIKSLRPPMINSMPIFSKEIDPAKREDQIFGFRFMGQRYTIDADIFQRLVEREVIGRFLPNGLDIPSAMGSKEAYSILENMGETKFANYPQNMDKMKQKISGMDKAVWSQNLYWNWMATLSKLLIERGAGFPKFMRNQAWIRKDLNSFLGSYAELKHDTILYAKQVYAEMGGGIEENQELAKGYVEPNPELYSQLRSLNDMTKNGLKNRGLLSEKFENAFNIMSQTLLKLTEISQKELENKEVSEQDYEFIRNYGGELEHFYTLIVDQSGDVNDNKAPIIADIATDPNGSVLEIGTGNILPIYAVTPINGKLVLTRGGVYSYYEFAWPINDRLTDSKWREILEKDGAPTTPEWTGMFSSK